MSIRFVVVEGLLTVRVPLLMYTDDIFCSASGSFIRHVKSSISKFKHSSKSTIRSLRVQFPLQGSTGLTRFSSSLKPHVLDFSWTSLCQQMINRHPRLVEKLNWTWHMFNPSTGFVFMVAAQLHHATSINTAQLLRHMNGIPQPAMIMVHSHLKVSIRHHMKTLKWIKSCHPKEKCNQNWK